MGGEADREERLRRHESAVNAVLLAVGRGEGHLPQRVIAVLRRLQEEAGGGHPPLPHSHSGIVIPALKTSGLGGSGLPQRSNSARGVGTPRRVVDLYQAGVMKMEEKRRTDITYHEQEELSQCTFAPKLDRTSTRRAPEKDRTPFWERMGGKRASELQAYRHSELKQKSEELSLQGCTHHPTITKKGARTRDYESGGEHDAVFERLYHTVPTQDPPSLADAGADAQQYQSRIDKTRVVDSVHRLHGDAEVRRQKLEDAKSCVPLPTFQPQINSYEGGSTSRQRYPSPARSLTPRGDVARGRSRSPPAVSSSGTASPRRPTATKRSASASSQSQTPAKPHIPPPAPKRQPDATPRTPTPTRAKKETKSVRRNQPPLPPTTPTADDVAPKSPTKTPRTPKVPAAVKKARESTPSAKTAAPPTPPVIVAKSKRKKDLADKDKEKDKDSKPRLAKNVPAAAAQSKADKVEAKACPAEKVVKAEAEDPPAKAASASAVEHDHDEPVPVPESSVPDVPAEAPETASKQEPEPVNEVAEPEPVNEEAEPEKHTELAKEAEPVALKRISSGKSFLQQAALAKGPAENADVKAAPKHPSSVGKAAHVDPAAGVADAAPPPPLLAEDARDSSTSPPPLPAQPPPAPIMPTGPDAAAEASTSPAEGGEGDGGHEPPSKGRDGEDESEGVLGAPVAEEEEEPKAGAEVRKPAVPRLSLSGVPPLPPAEGKEASTGRQSRPDRSPRGDAGSRSGSVGRETEAERKRRLAEMEEQQRSARGTRSSTGRLTPTVAEILKEDSDEEDILTMMRMAASVEDTANDEEALQAQIDTLLDDESKARRAVTDEQAKDRRTIKRTEHSDKQTVSLLAMGVAPSCTTSHLPTPSPSASPVSYACDSSGSASPPPPEPTVSTPQPAKPVETEQLVPAAEAKDRPLPFTAALMYDHVKIAAPGGVVTQQAVVAHFTQHAAHFRRRIFTKKAQWAAFTGLFAEDDTGEVSAVEYAKIWEAAHDLDSEGEDEDSDASDAQGKADGKKDPPPAPVTSPPPRAPRSDASPSTTRRSTNYLPTPTRRRRSRSPSPSVDIPRDVVVGRIAKIYVNIEKKSERAVELIMGEYAGSEHDLYDMLCRRHALKWDGENDPTVGRE
eukprot:TRINITY_DN15880_c0_g1_i1.p1 TRINITY_DN15880_c0_g1~~TRINITY_DN15880_c0_g1_i1.p1  ORF type:complete len:1131 (+),score=302.95 TRINITY_DN15880_c0_g1_i1:66-3458(+)